MPLIMCPDCTKKISDRVEACPFCGCPAEFFGVTQENVVNTSPASVQSDTNKELVKNSKSNETEEKIRFSFGDSQIEYPKSTEKIAKLYGKYVTFADEFYSVYYDIYDSVGSMYLVLSDLAKEVILDIQQIVDEACKDLYSFGIKITRENFIEKYEIDFQREIDILYNQYNDVQQEKKEISYKREVEKASRGRWEGGGFGITGAIKGAMKAAVLNAGSDLIHSIGDGITKSGDTRYINNKLNELYDAEENKEIFAKGVYSCFGYILKGIKEELSDAEIIDINIFGEFGEIESNYETIIKYEKNRMKLLAGMVECFSCIPERVKYYEPVINELFESDSDIESFLKFWGMPNLYESLEDIYTQKYTQNEDKNLYLRNVADVGIEVLDKPIICENGTVILGRLVKGRVHVGDSVAFLNNDCSAGLSTVISSIKEGTNECALARIGRKYEFMLPIKQTAVFDSCFMLVDSNSFHKPEANLYARYYEDGKEVIWGFSEYCSQMGNHVIFYFDAGDKYVSCRGVDFSYDATQVMKVYGNINKQIYDENSDVALSCAKDYNWESVLAALSSAAFCISYPFGEQYVLRYYFDDENKMLLAVYMKNLDLSEETNRIYADENVKELRREFCGILREYLKKREEEEKEKVETFKEIIAGTSFEKYIICKKLENITDKELIKKLTFQRECFPGQYVIFFDPIHVIYVSDKYFNWGPLFKPLSELEIIKWDEKPDSPEKPVLIIMKNGDKFRLIGEEETRILADVINYMIGVPEAKDIFTKRKTAIIKMFCPYCGKQILRSVKFCNFCGKTNNYNK